MSKILIIDDDPMITGILWRRLQEDGHSLESAMDGVAGLERVKEFKPDLILLDIIMPVLDGMAVLRQLKADPELSKIPVLVITNMQLEDQAAEATALGAVGYLVKVHHTSEDLANKVTEELKLRQ